MPQKLDESYVKRYVIACREEAESAKLDRMRLNEDNYAMYNLLHDFSHKRPGQSQEVLPKTRNGTEQIKAFFQQSLADLGEWFRVEMRNSVDAIAIKPAEAQKLLSYMLERADYFSHVGNSVQSGVLGALSISRVSGELVSKPKYKTHKEGKGKNYKKHVVMVEDKSWELRFHIVRQENFFPDPYKSGLYDIEDCYEDLHKVKQMSKGDDAIYDTEAVSGLKAWNGDEKEAEKRIETAQNTPVGGMRPRIKLTEMWGNIVDDETGDILAENVVVTLANDDVVIRKPTPNPLWHQRRPLIYAALIEVANSVWGIGLMDAGTKHNRSLTELFNLMLDSAMKAVWGIQQVRVDMLEDASQIQGGIPWGTALKTNASLAPGAKVIEEVITGHIQPEVITMFNMLTQETTTSMFSSDLRMGMQSSRDVKATQVVATENAITGVFQGLAKNFEQKKIQPELEMAWMTIAQNWDLIDPEIFKSLFGAERGEVLSQLEPEEVFVQTVNGFRFEVFGISVALRRQADFRKWTQLLQVIGGSEVLVEAFIQRYSFEKFLGEIMTAIDIDKSKIENEESAGDTEEALAAVEQPGGAPGAAPNTMSQVPAAANAGSANPLVAAFTANQMGMPSSQAIRR